jgi:hypothetical protein
MRLMKKNTISGLTYGHSEKTLSDAFDVLTRKRHWKDPISKWIPEILYSVYNDACKFYTATSLSISSYRFTADGETFVLVKSVGYRNGPAGP